MPRSLADAIQQRLRDLDIAIDDLADVSWLRPRLTTLRVGDRRFHAAVLYLPHMSATEALQASHAVPNDMPLLVVGRRIHEASAKTLRARGIWFVDESGNAYLRDRELLVDIRGRRADLSSDDLHQKSDATNPFSPRRSQVVLALINRPDLTDAPLREIAFHAGVSIGIAKGTIDTLAETGFVEQTAAQRRLIRGDELFDLWASTYPGGLGRANTLFVGAGDIGDWGVPDGLEFAMSGEHAVPGYIRHPESLVLYVRTSARKVPSDLLRMNRWRRESSGNVVVRQLFWRDLEVLDKKLAPAQLVYADLLATHEGRQSQVAHELRRDFERRL